MSHERNVRLRLALLYGSPLLTAAVSVAVSFALKRWHSAVLIVGPLFFLNAVLAVAGAAASGVIGRDNPGSRLRGAIDCGAFGLITHFVFAVALVVLLNELDIAKYL